MRWRGGQGTLETVGAYAVAVMLVVALVLALHPGPVAAVAGTVRRLIAAL